MDEYENGLLELAIDSSGDVLLAVGLVLELCLIVEAEMVTSFLEDEMNVGLVKPVKLKPAWPDEMLGLVIFRPPKIVLKAGDGCE